MALKERSLRMKDERQGDYLIRDKIQSMTESEAMDWLHQKSE